MAEVEVARPGRARARAMLAVDVARSQGGDTSILLHSGAQVHRVLQLMHSISGSLLHVFCCLRMLPCRAQRVAASGAYAPYHAQHGFAWQYQEWRLPSPMLASCFLTCNLSSCKCPGGLWGGHACMRPWTRYSSTGTRGKLGALTGGQQDCTARQCGRARNPWEGRAHAGHAGARSGLHPPPAARRARPHLLPACARCSIHSIYTVS